MQSFGSGFNNIYPKENIKLFYKILENDGLIISEYDLDAPPIGYHFTRRNRIIAALSNGVVLIEAKEKSGSISTAKYALNINRNLFVLPGAASNLNFRGSNKLLVKGAKCILGYEDILKEYNTFSNITCISEDLYEESEKIISIPEEYKEIYEKIPNIPISINQLSIDTNISIPSLSAKMTLMEMDGLIKSLPGKCFIKNY